MAATAEEEKVAIRYTDEGAIVDGDGVLLGYAPGHDPAIKGDERVLVDALSERFPDHLVQWKPGNGRRPDLAYISHALVTERLNRVFPGWSFAIKEVHTYIGANNALHCAGVTVSLTIGGIAREEMGGPARSEDFASECKNAVSDAIKRAAMRFGVALYLWEKLVDSMNDEDFRSDQQEQAPAPAPQQAQPAQTRQTHPAPTQSRMNQTIANLERARDQGEIGAATLPDRASRMAAQAQGPRPAQPRTGVDPAAIPGVVRGVANAKPATKYEEYFPNTTRMDEVRSYLAGFGITPGGQGNMNDCRIAVNQWVQANFQTPDAVKGTGNWNEQYQRNDLRPMDIGNALAHFAKQLSTDGATEAAEAAARDGDDGWGDESGDEVPF